VVSAKLVEFLTILLLTFPEFLCLIRVMEFNEENFKALMEENSRLKGLIAGMQQKLKVLLGRFFGKSSEKIDPNQLLMELDGMSNPSVPLDKAAAVEEPAKIRKDTSKNAQGKRKTLRERVPADIPVERHVIIPEEVQQNPEAYEAISEDVFEELEVILPQFKINQIVRPKFRKIEQRDEPPISAPAPKRLIDNCFATVSLVLMILLGKFCDHLPFYRQEQIFKRYGIDIDRKLMGNWLFLISAQLAIIYEAIRLELKATNYLQLDETSIRYIEPGNKKCKTGYLWAAHSPGVGVLFEWHPGRGHACLDKILKDYNGIIQTDGYEAYKTWLSKKALPRQKLIHAACWAHARRKFNEVKGSPIANQILLKIQELYRIETELREDLSADRSTIRLAKAQPVLHEIKELLEQHRPHPKAKNAVSKAINYTLERWAELNKYVWHSRLEIDNNLVENAIRPTAIGKKNFLFFGSESSGQDSAIIYSLIETCRKIDINPAAYLRDVLTALPAMTNLQAADWTPKKWKARQSSTATPSGSSSIS
jgi:transposase